MCELCELNEGKGGFIATQCKTCGDTLVVLREHRAEFNAEEMVKIGLMFRGAEIRWEQGHPEWQHAHCHISWKK